MNWKEKIEAQIAFFRLGTHHHVCKEDATMFADTMQALLDVAVAADDALKNDNGFANLACNLDELREVSGE